jgi:hypothetical protein
VELIQEWGGTALAFMSTSLLGLLVARAMNLAGVAISFFEDQSKRTAQNDELDGKVLGLLVTNNTRTGRVEAQLSAIFELTLLYSELLESPDGLRAVKAIERNLRADLMNEL